MAKRSLAIAALYEQVLANDGSSGAADQQCVLRVELAEEVRVLETLARRIRARIQPDWLALPLEILAIVVSQRHCSEATRRAFRLSCRTLRAAVDLNFSACTILPFHLRTLVYALQPAAKTLTFIPLSQHLWNLQTVEVTYRGGARPMCLPDLLDGRLPALRNLSLAEFVFPPKYAHPFSSLRPLDEFRIQRLMTTDAAQQLAQVMRCSIQRLVYDTSTTGAAGSSKDDRPRLKNDLDIFCKTVGRIRRSSPDRCVRRTALLLEVGKHTGKQNVRGLDVLPSREVIFGVFDELMLLDSTCATVTGLPSNCATCIDLRLYCFNTFAQRIYLASSQSNRTSAAFARWAVVLAANPDHSFGHYRMFCVDACVPYVAGLRRKYYPHYRYHNAQAEQNARSITLAAANATTLLGTPAAKAKKPVASFAPLIFNHAHDAHPFHFPTVLPLLVNDGTADSASDDDDG